MNTTKKETWKVFKFGGSSLANTACFVRVSKIILDSYIASEEQPHSIIVSAMGGFTDLLIKISNCLLYTSPSPRDRQKSRMPSSA